jgi:hypothetical protein
MSGLFLRLARQATGQVRNPVHAALSPGYQAGPSAEPFEPVDAQPGISPETTAAIPRTAVKPQRLPDVDTQPEPVARGNAGCADTPGQKQPAQRARLVDGERGDAPPPVAPAQQDAAAPRRVSERAVQAHDPAAIPAAILTASIATEGSDRHRADDHQPLAAQTTLENIIPETRPQTNAPEPLLASPATTAAVNRVTVERVPALPVAAPGEVHVHIGRIEVTALAPAAAPKAKRPAARQPMSLDDYLARRGQGSA